MGHRGFVAVGALIAVYGSSIASAQIYVADPATIDAATVNKRVRVSVKIIADADGNRPADGHYHDENQILSAIDEGNAALAALGADWRLDLIEIRDARGVSQWYGPWDCDRKNELDVYARAEPSKYLFRFDAINFYVVNELVGCGGYCSIPSSGEDVIIINNQVGIRNWSLGWLHEIGHYFGLQHTYQCTDRPCDGDHDICTGAGSERRDCPDACPDTLNLMSGHDGLTPGDAVLSPCQLQELAASMRADGGARSYVVEHLGPAGGGSTDCGISTGAMSMPTGASAMTATPGVTIVSGAPRVPPATVTTGGEPGTPESWGDSPCDGAADATPPRVLRIDAQRHPTAGNVTGVVIRFSEPIEIAQVQNGMDIAILYEEAPIDGEIHWRDNDTTLTWTATDLMQQGRYGIFLTAADESDFQDAAGNVLVANTATHFAVSFTLDSKLQVVLPNSPVCGAGAALPGMTAMLMFTRVRRRRRIVRRHST